MRKTCLNTVYELAQRDPRVVFIGSDLGSGTLDQFKKNLPDRFFMEGISEANIILYYFKFCLWSIYKVFLIKKGLIAQPA